MWELATIKELNKQLTKRGASNSKKTKTRHRFAGKLGIEPYQIRRRCRFEYCTVL
jgi:hypothetical protein